MTRYKMISAAMGCAVALFGAVGSAAATTSTNPSAPPDAAVAPGGRQVGNKVFYNGGAVVVTLAGPTTSTPCPNGWTCLYQDANWLGRMLQFATPGYWQNLSDYGFNDQTSSWSNHRGNASYLSFDAGGYGDHLTLGGNSHSAYVGDYWNDNASAIDVN